MKKQILALLLACMMIVSIVPMTVFADNTFTDVDEGKWYYDAVMWAVENGITTGTSETTFSPNQTCTRAQAMTFIWRAKFCPEPESQDNPFEDVSPERYYTTPILWAVEQNITNGTDAVHFSPNKACTRAQIVTFLWRTAGSPEIENTENRFEDVKENTYYYRAVMWALQNSITTGTNATHFSPNKKCTRAEIVTFLYRFSQMNTDPYPDPDPSNISTSDQVWLAVSEAEYITGDDKGNTFATFYGDYEFSVVLDLYAPPYGSMIDYGKSYNVDIVLVNDLTKEALPYTASTTASVEDDFLGCIYTFGFSADTIIDVPIRALVTVSDDGQEIFKRYSYDTITCLYTDAPNPHPTSFTAVLSQKDNHTLTCSLNVINYDLEPNTEILFFLELRNAINFDLIEIDGNPDGIVCPGNINENGDVELSIDIPVDCSNIVNQKVMMIIKFGYYDLVLGSTDSNTITIWYSDV